MINTVNNQGFKSRILSLANLPKNLIVLKVETISILTLNIDAHPLDREMRIDRVVSLLDAHSPDIVFLQETTAQDNSSDASEYIANAARFTLASQSGIGTAILSKFPVLESFNSSFKGSISHPSATFAKVKIGKHEALTCSAHLSWGSGMEVERLTQAQEIDAVFASYGTLEPFRKGGSGMLGFFGGDLNSLPDSATLRWLQGLSVENNLSTHWTDSWVRGSGSGTTSDPTNPLAARTAISANLAIWPEAPLPSRRIDYILSRGYAYGRPGAPLKATVIDSGSKGNFPSDHYALLATFAL